MVVKGQAFPSLATPSAVLSLPKHSGDTPQFPEAIRRFLEKCSNFAKFAIFNILKHLVHKILHFFLTLAMDLYIFAI